jgi:hypothetical protein
VEFGDDAGSNDNSQGLINIHSSSTDMDSLGEKRYSEW